MRFMLQEQSGDGPNRSFDLQGPGPILLGRGRGCGIQLVDTRISRRHCQLTFQNGRGSIEDLGTTNGTIVNERLIQRVELSDGDTIEVGRLQLVFRQDESATAARAAVTSKPDAPSSRAPLLLDSSRTQELAAHVPAAKPDPAARPLGVRYELGELVHQGSSGNFFRARDLKTGRTVCVKMLSKRVTADDDELKRFVRGLYAASKLKHPNVVQLHRGWYRGDHWYMAMEFVDGPSLRQVIAQYGIGNMLSPAKVLAIARDITAALEVAYERQVLHRNIRPENILLTKSGTAKLADFALVRGVALTTMQRITGSSELVGDLAYMAPERTEPDGIVDCRSDIYSLGACLYTLLAGRPPFTARGTVQLIDLVRHETPTPPSRLNLSVPGALEGVVMKCLAKSPTERYPSPMQLREELFRVARLH